MCRTSLGLHRHILSLPIPKLKNKASQCATLSKTPWQCISPDSLTRVNTWLINVDDCGNLSLHFNSRDFRDASQPLAFYLKPFQHWPHIISFHSAFGENNLFPCHSLLYPVFHFLVPWHWPSIQNLLDPSGSFYMDLWKALQLRHFLCILAPARGYSSFST